MRRQLLNEVDRLERLRERYKEADRRRKADMVMIPEIDVSSETKALLCALAEQENISITGLVNKVLARYLGYRGPMPTRWGGGSQAWSYERRLSARVPRKLRDMLKIAAARRQTSVARLTGAILAHYVSREMEKEKGEEDE